MGTRGAGGGRSFPLYIDYISRGADKAVSDLNKVQAAGSRIGAGVTSSTSQASAALDRFSRSAASGVAPLNNLNRAVAQGAGPLANIQRQAISTSQSLDKASIGARTFSATLVPLGTGIASTSSSLSTLTTTMNTAATSTTNLSNAKAALGERMRSMVFPMAGFAGAVSEATFMIDSLRDAETRLNTAKAEVARLTAAGAEETREYAIATKEAEDAQRAFNFTSRLTVQSVADILFFIAMVGAQMPTVIKSFRDFTTASGGVRNAISNIIASISGPLQSGITKIAGAFTATSASADFMGARLTQSTATMTASSAASNVYTGSLARMNVTQTVAAATATGMTGALGNAGRQLLASGAAATVAAGGWAVFTAAMNTAGKAALAFVTNPIGALLIAFGATVALLLALKDNFGGVTDAAFDLGGALAEMGPTMKGVTLAFEGFGEWLGIIPSEEKAVIEATKTMNDEWDKVGTSVDTAMAAFSGVSLTLQEVGDQITGFIEQTSASAIQFGDEFTTVYQNIMDQIAALPADTPIPEGMQKAAEAADHFAQGYARTWSEVQSISAAGGADVEATLNAMLSKANEFPVAIEQFAPHVTSAIETIGRGFETIIETTGTSEAQIMFFLNRMSQGIATQLPAGFEQAVPGIQGAFNTITNEIAAWGTKSHTAYRINLGVLQEYAKGQQELADQTTEDVAVMNERVRLVQAQAESLKLLDDATGEVVKVNEQNVDTIAAEANIVATVTAAEASRAAMMEKVQEGLIGINLQAHQNIGSNQQIITGIKEQTQAFNENNVMLEAQAQGLQTWRDAQAEAYASIVENATALGFAGEATSANVVAMLDHIAVTERQNEVNQTAVEGFFSLSAEQRATIDSSGALAQRMGQVALMTEDVTAADAALIAEQVRLNEANQKAAETYFGLTDAQRAYLDGMGVTPEVIQQVIDGEIQLSDAMIQAITTQGKAAEAVDEHKQAISELIPELQKYADMLGLTNMAAEDVTLVQSGIVGVLQEADTQYKSGVQGLVDYAASQGKLGEIAGMTEMELAVFVATMGGATETAEQAAERQAQAAKDLADAWETDLQRTVQAWENSSSAFSTAAENISDEIGDAGAEGAIKFTEGFLTEFVPQQVVEEAFDENFNIEDLIDDIQDKADEAIEDGLISEIAARDAIEPMLAAMEEIPGETEFHMGQMIAIARNTMENLKPVVSGGVHEVGKDAMSAIESDLLTPMQNMLAGGAGTGVWAPLVDNFRQVVANLPPEYDRMKGDWLQMLTMAGSDTREQVNVIMAILGEIAPEWAAQIDQMDADGDGIKDLWDEDVVTPAQAMRDAVVDAFEMILIAIGRVSEAEFLNQLQEDFNRTEEAARRASQPVWDVGSAIDEAGKKAGLASPPTEEFMNWFGEQTPDIQSDARELYNVATAIGGTQSAADGAKTAYGGYKTEVVGASTAIDTINASLDANEKRLRDSKTAAENTAEAYTKMINAMKGLTTAERESDILYGQTGRNKPVTSDPLTDSVDRRLDEAAGDGAGTAPAAGEGPVAQYKQMAADIKGILTQLNADVKAHTDMMSLHWNHHLTTVGAQIMAFGAGPLVALGTAYQLFQTMAIPVIQQMELAWTLHLQNTGAQIMAFGQTALVALGTAYTLFQTMAIPIIQQMELAWTNHVANSGAQILSFVTTVLMGLMQQYITMQTLVPGIIALMETAWTNHLGNSGGQIQAFLQTHVAAYINIMPMVAEAVHSNLENANQNWSAHEGHLGNVVDAMIDHLNNLADEVSSTMDDIAQSMGTAEQAARDLKSAIDALQNKTITVTTNFVTNGARPAAKGMNTTLREPTLILAGEAGAERVKITPLTNAASSSDGIFRAAKGADMIVGEKLDAKAVSNFAGERGMRLDEFKEDTEDGKIDVEVRKVYKSGWIDKDDWKAFAKEYGYRISDFDKKKNGKLADIMFRRMKGVTFQEKDDDFGGEDETARKKADWGVTRSGSAMADQDAFSGEGAIAPQLGQRVSRPGTTGGGGMSGGGGGGGSTSGGSIMGVGAPIVQTTLNLSLIVDKRNFAKLVQEVESDGYYANK